MIISQVENVLGSFIWLQQSPGVHLTGKTCVAGPAGVTSAEKTSKLTEPTENSINRRADFFNGIE